jgi:peptidyl-prolyl cis-trans isomerase C
MKKTLIILIALAAIDVTGWQIARSQQTDSVTESVDESQVILAEYQWNGRKFEISLADFKAAIGELPIYYQENYASRAEKAKYLPEFIDERLKVLAAIDKRLDKDEALLKKVQDYKHTRLVERLTLIEVDEKVSPTEEDLRRYYEEHKSEYVEEAAAQATCISVVEKALAQEALTQIKAGVDISELAKGLSEKEKLFGPGSNKVDPGNTGFFTKDESKDWQDFVDAVFNMEVGEMTEDVFELEVDQQAYYLIFRKEAHKPERIPDFEEVRDYIESPVKRDLKRRRIIEWVAEVTAESRLKTYPERIPEGMLDEDQPVTNTESIVVAEFDCNGKQQITLAEMIQDISELSEYAPERYKDKARLEEYMTLMAEGRLILCLAEDRKLDEDPEIQKKVQNHLHMLLVNKITELEVEQKLKVTPEDMRAYYESHKNEFAEEEQVRLTCITLNDRNRAEKIFESIQSGKDIAEAAKELADSGELIGPGAGTANPGDTGYFAQHSDPREDQAFVDAAFAMEVGQTVEEIITVTVRGQKRYIIFRKEEHKASRHKAFDEEDVQRQVGPSARGEQRVVLTNNLHLQLRDKAKPKIYFDRIPEQSDK